MKTWSLIGAVIGAGVMIVPAYADVVTSKIVNWNAKTQQLTLSDNSQFNLDPKQVALPASFVPGATVEIIFAADEDGVSEVNAVTVLPDAAPAAEGDDAVGTLTDE